MSTNMKDYVGRSNWIPNLFLSLVKGFEKDSSSFQRTIAHVEYCKLVTSTKVLQLIACIDWNVGLFGEF